MRFNRLPLLLIGLAASFNLQAEFGLGVGLSHVQSPYRGVSSSPNTLPAYINYEGKRGYFRGIEGGLHLWSQGERGNKFTISALGALRMDGYKADDSDYLQDMEKRKWSLDAGLGLAVQKGYNRFSARVVADTLRRHKGYSAGVGYAYIMPITRNFILIPAGHATWQSDNLLDYYYGVKTHETNAQLGRDAYQAKGGVQLRTSLAANYQLNPRTSFTLVATVRRLPTNAIDSPLVSREYISALFGAVTFNF